ncbi:hypothetical protein LB507_009089, partial [Fusarium sp. FIESC RH6]
KTVHYTSGTAVKPWLLSADILRAGAGLLGWGVDLGSQVIKPILNNFYTRRTMRTGVEMPDGKTVYPAQDILPHTINVREVEYRDDDPIGKRLAELGKDYADKLFKFDSADIPEVAMTGTQAGETSKDNNSEVMMNFGVHREAPISAWDPRTIEIFNKKGSGLYDNKEKLERRFTKAVDTLPHTKRRKENAVKASSSYDVELVATVGSRNGTKTRTEILHVWNNPTEDLQSLVANLSTMSTGVNLHKCCGSGMFLSWHPSASVLEQTKARLISIGQKRAVRWEMIRTKNTYYGNIERVVVEKWILQTAAQSGLPEWLKYEYLEICLCGLMKLDELFEGTSDLEESDLETDDEGLEEDSSGEEDGGGGGGRGSATKSCGRQNQGGRKRNADTAGIAAPENGHERAATETGAAPNGAFDHLNNKRKAKRSQLSFTLIK